MLAPSVGWGGITLLVACFMVGPFLPIGATVSTPAGSASALFLQLQLAKALDGWLIGALALYVGAFGLGVVRRSTLIELGPAGARVRRLFGAWDEIRGTREHDAALEIQGVARNWRLTFDMAGAREMVAWLRQSIDERLSDHAAGTVTYPPVVARGATRGPIALRQAALGWALALAVALLLSWGFDATMLWAFGAELRTGAAATAIIGLVTAATIGLWPTCAGWIEPFFRETYRDLSRPHPECSVVLAHDIPAQPLRAFVTCVLTYLWTSPYSLHDDERVAGSAVSVNTVLSHAALMFALGYGITAARRTRLLWLNRRSVLISGVLGDAERVHSAREGAGTIELRTPSSTRILRFAGPAAPHIVAVLARTIRERIGENGDGPMGSPRSSEAHGS